MEEVAITIAPTGIALICNRNYIVPTVAAALSARANVSDNSIMIIVYVIDADKAWEATINGCLNGSGIAVAAVDIEELEAVSKFHSDRYLPPVTLARFWIHEFLPKHITKFLYIDGDTLVSKSLDDLLAMDPPAGKIVAAPDNLQIFSGEFSYSRAGDERYLSDISTSRSRYFNAGVLYVSRETWAEKSKQALKFLVENSDICRSSDQSALNHVFRNDEILISQLYNYQTEHMMVDRKAGEGASPIIYHFTGGPKPWDEPTWPWSSAFNETYHIAAAMLSKVAGFPPVSPEAQTEAGKTHRARFRFRQAFVYPWRRYLRQNKLKRLERTALGPT